MHGQRRQQGTIPWSGGHAHAGRSGCCCRFYDPPNLGNALVMVPVSAVVIGAMAWRMVWGEGKKRRYVLTRERRKLMASGLFAFLAIAVGALMTIMQPGNPILALGFPVAAAQINALFEGTRLGRTVAAEIPT